jgi:muconolactone D-isomerase
MKGRLIRCRALQRFGAAAFSGDILLYHVEIVVEIPHDVDPEKIKTLSAAEVELAKMMQQEGKWLHIWRIVGKWANISVFDVKDGAELHEILTSLPLYPYMKIEVAALCIHPASIENDQL